MSNDTETSIAALKQVGAGITRACDDTAANIMAFGAAFNAAYERAAQNQASRVMTALSKRNQ